MFKSPLSAFTPSLVVSRVIVGSAFNQSESQDDSNEKTSNPPQTRVWNDEMTMYVMLKYRRWQIRDRNKLTLSQFHKTCSQISNGNFTWKQEKSTVLPRKLFKFLDIYFSDSSFVTIDKLDEEICLLIQKNSSKFTLSSQLKSAILRMRTHE
ncbi:Uncharacterized protein QTN25_000446 [Entamoeba marina]